MVNRSSCTNASHISAFLLLILLILFVPLQWLTAWVVAVSVHELGHVSAVLLCGGKITHFTFRIDGLVLESSVLPRGKQFLCIMAGPLCALTLILFANRFPRTAFCALIQSIYNLLPVYPLDGGKILHLLLEDRCPPQKIQYFQKIFLLIIQAVVWIAAVWCVFYLRLGPTPVLLTVLITIKIRKTPCKVSPLAVQ